MKSLLKPLLILLFAVCSVTACIAPQGPQGPAGPPGTPGADGYVYFDVQYYNITRWNLAANGEYFFAEVSNAAITNKVFLYGAVVGYLVIDYDKSSELHIPLPHEMFFNGYSETVSFDIMPGSIAFYYKPSNFDTNYTPPPLCFKIVAMW